MKKLIAKIERANRTRRRCSRDTYTHQRDGTFSFPTERTSMSSFGLSAIFISNAIIPGRRPENQPDGLSPTTTARTETNREKGRETEGREKERKEQRYEVKRRSEREKLIVRFEAKQDPRKIPRLALVAICGRAFFYKRYVQLNICKKIAVVDKRISELITEK